MSASAKRLIRVEQLHGAEPEEAVKVNRGHVLSPEQAVERCVDCGRRLSPGQHELCPRCDARAFDALAPLARMLV